ncbi:Proline dehydrogenase, partial [Halorubrum coriense DSM 10284]
MIPPIASNFVAGETPEAALAHVEALSLIHISDG